MRSPTAIIALLTALNLLNYLDRYLVVAVGPRVQESLHLNDREIGSVISAFMFGYFLTSPIFGWLGDRYPRKGLIAAGVAVWSLATAVSGLAGSLGAMIAARVAVGVGEASYATLSPTIIDDLADKKSKNRYLAIFYVAIPVGSALGYLVGGELENRYGWRSAFFIAGGPGLVLALSMLFVKEPARQGTEGSASRGGAEAVSGASRGGAEAVSGAGVPARQAYAELARQPLYVSAVAGYVAQTFALGGFTAWAAPFLYRKLCMELHVANQQFGTVTVVTGLVGTAVGGWVADRWPGEDRVRVCLKICALSSAIAAPLALAALFMKTPQSFLIALGACELAVFISVAPTNAAVLLSVPPAVRANAMAASIFAMHLLGDLISPPLIGAVSDGYGDQRSFCSGAVGLQMGMYLLPVALAVSALLWGRGALRRSAG